MKVGNSLNSCFAAHDDIFFFFFNSVGKDDASDVSSKELVDQNQVILYFFILIF